MINKLLQSVLILVLVITSPVAFLAAEEGAEEGPLITIIVSGDELRGHEELEFAAPIAPHMLDSVMTVTLINQSEEFVLIAGMQFHRALEWQIIDEQNNEVLYKFTRVINKGAMHHV